YTLPVWASPLKSRNYRGDSTLDAQVYSAVTGQTVTQKDLETMALRNFSLYRALLARYQEYWFKHPDPTDAPVGTGTDMRNNFDQLPGWTFKENGTPNPGTAFFLPKAEFDTAKDLSYQLLGFDTNGLPTKASLNSLGLNDVATALQAAGFTLS
ncbi:MAG TPA: aldehyde ferredoxin oxidoreductase C-terminal domain-containing protein, partial [Myxococcales bacterium]|nr:aldehyde ferredoxin oxidoreductase C-terminal domain-containing protein [Myxococcales bacterium]